MTNETNKEQLYYAKIKGWELISAGDAEEYWSYNIYEQGFEIGLQSGSGYLLTRLTKEEWNKSGINDTNADFEKVEE